MESECSLPLTSVNSPASAEPDPAFPRGLFIVGALLALSLGFVTPPFGVPDEHVHFYRAYQISEGIWVPYSRGDEVGGELPASLPGASAGFLQMRNRPDAKIESSSLMRALGWPLDASVRRFVRFDATVAYSPVAYAPQALGIAIARTLGLGPLPLLYGARLANLAVALMLIWFALKRAPNAKWVLAWLAFSPMAAFQLGSVSPDALTNTSAFALIACLFARASSDDGMTRSELFTWIALGLLLSLGKQVYLVVVLLIIGMESRCFGSRTRQFGVLAIVLAIGAFGVGSWALASRSSTLPESWVAGVDPGAQIAWIWAHPFELLGLLFAEVRDYGPQYIELSFGRYLGWLDTELPRFAIWLFAAFSLGIALWDGDASRPLKLRLRVVSLAVAVMGISIVALGAYVFSNPPGAAEIRGIQGRYFIPLSPLVFLPLAAARFRTLVDARLTAVRVRAGLPIALGGFSAMTLYCVITRYYSG
ncbi:MAG: DUF2142 domain-containing protein [bacterium]|nr:DUF2142 domain-containing protein [bacterium]